MATTLVPSAFSLQPSALLLCIENAQQLIIVRLTQPTITTITITHD